MRNVLSTLGVLAICGVLLLLGSWQMQRLQYKNEVIARMQSMPGEELSLEPCHIDARVPFYSRLRLTGGFDMRVPLAIYAAHPHTGQPGHYVVLPFKCDNGEGVLVNVGWTEGAEPNQVALQQWANIIHIEGVLLPAESDHWWRMASDPTRNRWYWMDVSHMADSADISYRDGYIRLLATSDVESVNAWYIPPEVSVASTHHLFYGIMWYVLAGIWMAIAFLRLRKR